MAKCLRGKFLDTQELGISESKYKILEFRITFLNASSNKKKSNKMKNETKTTDIPPPHEKQTAEQGYNITVKNVDCDMIFYLLGIFLFFYFCNTRAHLNFNIFFVILKCVKLLTLSKGFKGVYE